MMSHRSVYYNVLMMFTVQFIIMFYVVFIIK